MGSTETAADASEADAASIERQAHVEDETIVGRQLDRYEDEGIIDQDHPEWAYFKLDLLRYWQVCARKNVNKVHSLF